ncbi:MAG: methyl-accepting chemotaxis protein, partial [Candidatus Competibacteraceae bacterium]|nr:methyl-accepting chemotaxis protein [Candidatus Competibacteraceae bacterium]
LTVQVPVSEDITGNVSDALNMMTRRTAATMGEINSLAAQLEQAALAVQQQGEKVAQVAATERQVVDQALASLGQSAETMNEMAQLAASSNELADNTSTSTKRALGAVRNTVQNMNAIRNTVSETEKSIKRLGERSQEIGAIVEIIKDIAERTHTLALNAGMQAVAAGEAGRGFSVVADEVQRLAETARESTAQIATLVQSIQAESSETMATMNKTISQVVEGSELAERSGKRMRVTQKATLELVSAVQQIAERSTSLVETNEALRGQAAQLRQSTQATEQELEGQAQQTRGMFTYLQNLVAAVRVFKLPESAKVEQSVDVVATPEATPVEDAISTEKAA